MCTAPTSEPNPGCVAISWITTTRGAGNEAT